MATLGGPRPGNFAPGNIPNVLANSFQNLGINQPNQEQPSNAHSISLKPPNAPPFRQQPPPPGMFPGGPVPSTTPAQTTLHPNMMPSRPNSTILVLQPPLFASRPPPPGAIPSSLARGPAPATPGVGSLSSPTIISHPSTPPQPAASISNRPPAFGPWTTQSGLRSPPSLGNMPHPSAGPPQSPTLPSGPSTPSLQMHYGFGSPSTSASYSVGQSAPPFQFHLKLHHFQPCHKACHLLQGHPHFHTQYPAIGMPQPSNTPMAMQPWPPRPQQQGIPPQQQPPQLYAMPPGALPLPNQSMALGQMGQSKIDPNQIPRLTPSSPVIIHETRQDNQAYPPPPATIDYIVKDTGNCSPWYMRCTINQIPCTVDLRSTSAMQLALLVQPLALPHPSEEPIQVVDFGERGPVRCSWCKGYINPFMKFIDQGRRFVCNLCGAVFSILIVCLCWQLQVIFYM